MDGEGSVSEGASRGGSQLESSTVGGILSNEDIKINKLKAEENAKNAQANKPRS